MGGKEKWRMGESEQKEEKWRKYLHGWHQTEFLTNFACLTVSDIVGQCALYDIVDMYHSNSQLTG